MKSTWTMLALAFCVTAASGDEAKPSKEDIAAKLNGVSASDIGDSPIEGLYQITLGSTIAYVTADGQYLIQGDVYDLQNLENVTENARAGTRKAMLGAVDREDMIVFSPPNGNAQHTITIFTDIDCGYCRQFHREIDRVTALGIEVHYLFYPRTGPATESWDKAANVWCAEDRNTALTQAKLGGKVPENDCGETTVDAHFSLGQRVGVRGTPAIFAENGELIGGYLPPDQLAATLAELVEP